MQHSQLVGAVCRHYSLTDEAFNESYVYNEYWHVCFECYIDANPIEVLIVNLQLGLVNG